MGDPWWIWLLPILFSAPWIAGIIWFWPRDRSENEVSPSTADLAARRLWPR
jgi:hypothetical protein